MAIEKRIKLPFKGKQRSVVRDFKKWYRKNNNSRNFISGPGDSLVGMMVAKIKS